MSINILTLDWDYFFNVDVNTREFDFPQIYDGRLKSVPDNSVWLKDRIYQAPQSFDMKSYLRLVKALEPIRFYRTFLSENHGEMLNVVKEYVRRKDGYYEPIEVTNVDFHHDYSYNNGYIECCDNWARLLVENCPTTKIKWCKRKDSVTTSFGCPVPVEEITFEEVLENIKFGYYQYVHLCRSDLYAPPLRDGKFEVLVDILEECSEREEIITLDHIENPRKEYFEYRKLYKEVNKSEK